MHLGEIAELENSFWMTDKDGGVVASIWGDGDIIVDHTAGDGDTIYYYPSIEQWEHLKHIAEKSIETLKRAVDE